MIPWEQVRAEALEEGRVTHDALVRAQVEQDAYVAGYRLAELRGKAGMTQAQLAEAMGVSQARVSAMERGEVDSLTVASVRGYITALGRGRKKRGTGRRRRHPPATRRSTHHGSLTAHDAHDHVHTAQHSRDHHLRENAVVSG